MPTDVPVPMNAKLPADSAADQPAAEPPQLRLLAAGEPPAVAYFEAKGKTCRFANIYYARTFGFDERSILGLTVDRIIGPDAARLIGPQVDRVILTRIPVNYERQLVIAQPHAIWVEVNLVPQGERDGQVEGVVVVITDTTRRHRAEEEVLETQQRLDKFMQATMEGIVFHRQGLITDINESMLALLGYSRAEVLGRSTQDFVAPAFQASSQERLSAGTEGTNDCALVHRDGSVIPVDLIARSLLIDGEPQRMNIVRDQRDRLAAQSHIRFLATHDALTGLPNRGFFLEQMAPAMTQAARHGDNLALMFVDIDHFKRVNDSLGHLAGDRLLQVVAQRITSTLRASDLVARFAGDEFVVLLAGNPQLADIDEVARKLLMAIEAPVELDDGPQISVTPSIGIALFPQHSQDPAELLKQADTAMYHAKAHGRARLQLFEPEMARAAYAALVMESELATALREGQFELHYQPQVRLVDGALAGYEALVRWRHPQRGLIAPNEFVPLAEERRLMLGIGRWVLGEALRQALVWRRAGLAMAPVGVNLSNLQFQAKGFVELAEQALLDHGASGDCLELELTERMLMDDVDAVRATLQRLRARNIRVAVDDFGTGFTSLSQLKSLPLDRLKIDRSFVVDLPGNRPSAAIADAIIRMALGLGLSVVAEGVEEPAQLDWLAAQGCTDVQGHLIAPPMNAADFEDWLRERERPARPGESPKPWALSWGAPNRPG